MEFIKKHYEKVILGVVLLILGAAAAYMPFALTKEKGDIEIITTPVSPPKQYQPLDLSTQQLAIAQLQASKPVAFEPGHNVFNPVVWKLKPGGGIIKIDSEEKEGFGAVKVLDIRQLYLHLTLDRAAGGGFYVGVLREAASPRKTQKYATVGAKMELTKADIVTLKEVKGAGDDSSELVLDLDFNGAKETVTIAKDKPFKRAEGFAVDLKYDLENKTFLNKRVGDVLSLANEHYKIIDIKQNEVRVQALSNLKNTIIRWNAAP